MRICLAIVAVTAMWLLAGIVDALIGYHAAFDLASRVHDAYLYFWGAASMGLALWVSITRPARQG